MPPLLAAAARSALVPPLASGRMPDTAAVSETLPHAGAVVMPPESNTFPVAMSANFAKEVVVSA